MNPRVVAVARHDDGLDVVFRRPRGRVDPDQLQVADRQIDRLADDIRRLIDGRAGLAAEELCAALADLVGRLAAAGEHQRDRGGADQNP